MNLLISLTCFSYGQQDTSLKKVDSTELLNINKSYILDKSEYKNPFVFLDAVMKYNEENKFFATVVVGLNDFPLNWVKREDIDSLIHILQSKIRCQCFFNIIYSGVPNYHDYSELGGYVIEFINSYRQNRKVDLGLYRCPKIDNDKIKDILYWYQDFKTK